MRWHGCKDHFPYSEGIMNRREPNMWHDCVLGEGNDFQCPHCGKGLEVQEWPQEYGDPLVGENSVICCACRKDFTLIVQREIIYKVRA